MLGDLYSVKGEYSSSSKYYLASLEIFEKNKNTKSIILLYSALGDVYRASGNFRKSLYFLHLAEYKANSAKLNEYLPKIQSRLASTYFELNYNDFLDPDYIFLKDLYKEWFHTESEFEFWQNQTYKYVHLSQQKAIVNKDSSLQILNNNLLGSYYFLKKDYDSAIYYHTMALTQINNYPSSKDASLVLSSLSHGYRKKGNLLKAKYFGTQALELANKADIRVYKWLALSALNEVSKALGDYKKALEYVEAKDSIYLVLINNGSRQKIFELQERYNVGQKEDEIEKLQLDKNQESRSRMFLIAIFILVSFTLTLILIVVSLRFQNLRQKKIIAEDEKKRNEILLEKSEAINKARNDFFANISHEIRTPLNSILGFSEILQEKVFATETKEYLSGIISSGRSLLALINDLMDVSRIEAGKIVLLVEQVNLPSLCEEVKNIFHLKTLEKNLQLTITSNLSHDYYFLDEARLRQILLNIIGNSVKYTVEGTISVRIQNIPIDDDYDKLILEITDSGIGIAPEQMEQLFSPFHQVSEAHTRLFGGSGLGLMICKRLVELMNGTIEVQSEKGIGTSTKIVLLKAKRYVPLEITESATETNHRFANYKRSIKLLLVEDNISNRVVIKTFLEDFNIEIIEASNGQEAIDVLKKFIPDIIIMDIQMPVMGGFEATKIIKNNPITESIPVIALTATVFRKDQEIGIFNEVIYKPISKKTLLSLINKFFPSINKVEEEKNADDEKQQSLLSPEVRSELRNNLMLKWKQTTVLLSNDDIEEFGEMILKFSTENNITELINWSKMVIEYSTTFNIKMLYETFNKFPNLVQLLLK